MVDALAGIKWDDAPAPATGLTSADSGPQSPSDQLGIQWDSDKYGSTAQQVLTATEGAAQGFAGPVATAAEAGLSALGVPGLTPEEQEMRARVNPTTKEAAEVVGFGLGALTGAGEAKVISKLGEAAGAAAGLGKATLAARLATQGIKTGAEIAALQAGNEASKFINQDPSQTLGSAAINIGLSGLLGAATGVPLGGVSELWAKGLAKADGLINDVKQRVAYRQALEAGEIPASTVEESSERVYDPFTKQWVDRHPAEELAPHGEESVGTRLGDWMFDKGRQSLSGAAARSVGEAAGETVGALGGLLAGHPIVGGYVGGKVIGPVISSIAKPMLERATDGAALKGAVDYLSAAVKGEAALTRAVSAIFEGGKVLEPQMLPDQEDRDKVQAGLNSLASPTAAIDATSRLAHYLPEHAVAAGSLMGQAKTYLDGLSPAQAASTPFNVGQTTHWQQGAYNRALDVAEQPLIVLKRVQDGSLTSQDVATLDALYPGLRKGMGDKLVAGLTQAYASKQQLPLHQRQAIGLLLGSTPTDGSLIPSHLQAIMSSQGPQQAQNRRSGASPRSSPTTEQLKTVNKAQDLYSTQLGRREAKR